MQSETSKCREALSIYCIGYGIDIGYGGDLIVPHAISIDLPMPYSSVGSHPLNLGGDGRSLYWFKDNTLDFVFSSHLLEDFPEDNIIDILNEWLRVLRPSGFLILFLPDEKRYRKYCNDNNQIYNQNHSIENMSLCYMTSHVIPKLNVDLIKGNDILDDYSFEIVLKKLQQ